MISDTCFFLTPRLLVKEWHSLTPDEWMEQDLADVVTHMLTDRVTQSLPTDWKGAYTLERARKWISERDSEGTTLLVVTRATGVPAGLVILFETVYDSNDGVELRLGYLLAEAVWGGGVASELIRGFVGWCERNNVASIVGGVERGNVASRRVLEKNGFVCDPTEDDAGSEEDIFRLQRG